MDARFEIYNEYEQLVLSLADAVAGDVVLLSTGKSNGSYTALTEAGEFVEFAYHVLIQAPPGPGKPSPFPQITVLGNQISWGFDVSGDSLNTSVDIMVFTY